MPALLIRHKVDGYPAWKRAFDELDDTMRAHGCLGSRLFRNADDPDEALMLLTWDDLERARLFAQSDELRDAMWASGGDDEPDIWFLVSADHPVG